MNRSAHGVRREDLRELARLIRRQLRAGGEVVLDTEEVGQFLANGHPLDGVRVQEVIRDLADVQGWTSFVFDYGARVRFIQPAGGPMPPRNVS
jgi:hypothetical protein